MAVTGSVGNLFKTVCKVRVESLLSIKYFLRYSEQLFSKSNFAEREFSQGIHIFDTFSRNDESVKGRLMRSVDRRTSAKQCINSSISATPSVSADLNWRHQADCDRK